MAGDLANLNDFCEQLVMHCLHARMTRRNSFRRFCMKHAMEISYAGLRAFTNVSCLDFLRACFHAQARQAHRCWKGVDVFSILWISDSALARRTHRGTHQGRKSISVEMTH